MVSIKDTIHLVYENFLTHEECSHISYILQRDEEKVLSIPNEDAEYQIYTGLTQQHTVYNWLNHEEIQPLNIPQRLLDLPIYKEYNHLKVQCWGNILHNGQNIPLHTHNEDPYAPLHALNIFLNADINTYTHYEDTGKTLNTLGELHLVSCNLPHEVKTHTRNTPRISLAMDVYFDQFEDTEGRWGFKNSQRFLDVYRSNV